MDNIVAIIDRSGSMTGYETATINGFNEFIEEQLKVSEDAVVTLILFDHDYKVVFENKDLVDVPELTKNDYRVRGSTALNDAIGYSIAKAKAFEVGNKVDKTIFAIFTDGGENASREFATSTIKKEVKSLENDKGWEFIYVGCDHNVMEASQNLGMKVGNTITFNKGDMHTMYDANTRGFTSTVSAYRTSSDT